MPTSPTIQTWIIWDNTTLLEVKYIVDGNDVVDVDDVDDVDIDDVVDVDDDDDNDDDDDDNVVVVVVDVFFCKTFLLPIFAGPEHRRTLKVRKPRSESQIPEVESRTPNMRPWTSFQRSGTLFRGGPLSPELFRGGPVFRRSGTLFRGGPLSPELHRRTIKSGTPLEADYDISKVRNSISGRTIKSGTPLEADYDISKVRNSLEADYDISKVRNLEADRDFEGPELEADRRSERSGPSYFEGPEL
ncbi:hypothetical protein RCL_jg3993.t1 [Rhizophagus clarus]|uniref:Uncharacterized protein n=1 Tax=Rhizophagus clarus TaxID=94130 RepID=A0A8H3QAJ9_9GLOM|nr:hypothetical protein RCL_jg3993.t1 [Rhizophagus clarus]